MEQLKFYQLNLNCLFFFAEIIIEKHFEYCSKYQYMMEMKR
jgi:hypothetical protein